MTTWDPKQPQNQSVDKQQLAQFLTLTEQQLTALVDHLSEETINNQRFLMSLSLDDWQPVGDHFSAAELKQLVKFFTLAEMQLPGWEGQDKSPVIWLCKILKQQGEFPDKTLTQWVKANSNNRFLPYGSVL